MYLTTLMPRNVGGSALAWPDSQFIRTNFRKVLAGRLRLGAFCTAAVAEQVTIEVIGPKGTVRAT